MVVDLLLLKFSMAEDEHTSVVKFAFDSVQILKFIFCLEKTV